MQMTFKRLFLAIGLSVLLCAHANADTMQLGSMARADFERDFMFSAGQEALIGGQADRLYFATKDGAVAVTGLDGKTIFTLQAKDAEGNPVLKSPRGVAVTAEVIYVVDSALNQIAMFSKDGVYQASFGAGKGRFFGSSGGVDIKEAKAVVAHEGVVYVLDKGGKKIQMFGSNGVYLSALELTPSGAAKPPKGEEEVHLLKEPVDLRVDVRGHLYVLDAGDALIKVYQLNGEYLRHLPKAGRLAAFAVAQDGVYVADYEKLTIQKYDFNDAAIYRFGSKGREKGQFQSISDLQVVQDREVVIGDGNNKAMSVFVTDMGDTMESVPKPMTRPFVKWEASYPVFASKLVSDGADYVYGINGDEKSIVGFK